MKILQSKIENNEIKRPFVRQYYFFLEALKELYEEVDELDISIDHENCNCYYKNKKYGLIYPKKWISLLQKKEKSIDFFFSGYKNPKNPNIRNWIFDYKTENSVIFFSDNGRKIKRDHFDENFFTTMLKSKFCLCPQGYPYKWTYRFYESILCKCVPILTKKDIVPEYLNYKFLIHGNKNIKKILEENFEEIIDYNYSLALKRLFLK